MKHLAALLLNADSNLRAATPDAICYGEPAQFKYALDAFQFASMALGAIAIGNFDGDEVAALEAEARIIQHEARMLLTARAR